MKIVGKFLVAVLDGYNRPGDWRIGDESCRSYDPDKAPWPNLVPARLARTNLVGGTIFVASDGYGGKVSVEGVVLSQSRDGRHFIVAGTAWGAAVAAALETGGRCGWRTHTVSVRPVTPQTARYVGPNEECVGHPADHELVRTIVEAHYSRGGDY